MSSNLMRRGTTWLRTKLRRHASESITYVRGSEAYFIRATRGRSEFQQNDTGEGGGVATFESVDWIIGLDQLPSDFIPQQNDEISDSDRSYRVSAFNPESSTRYSGVHRKMYRVHTTRI